MGFVGWAAVAALIGVTPTQAQEPSRDWQQGVEYRIEARLDEDAELLQGRARIRYRNDSPDTLRTFWLHQYLNAFRPNSAWARSDLERGIRTFQDLGPDEHGFERIRDLTVEGAPVRLRYPFAPDSTIVGFDLPDPLGPGASIQIDVGWDARPSSVPRRQGRRGRQWDLAQWYPRVVVYDDEGWRVHPLYRAGEFYGEFATYDITMDLAADQVVGATGAPVEGDPGWEAAAALGTGPVAYQREWYGTLSGPPCVERGGERICGAYPARSLRAAEPLGMLEGDAAPAGRKRVRWYAENVHHFAWSASPEYIYEQGRWEDVVIRVLYRPGDEEDWGGGVAVRRTATALQWLDSIFGDYPYPQVTNLHRIEGGGTEFPMLIMDGSASQSLILHEVGHIYAHGILANNEWYEGWLDEGMSSFQTSWYFEWAGEGPGRWLGSRFSVIRSDLLGLSEPVVLRGEDYSEYGAYSAAVYTKGSVILWMLREMVGEETMVRILRTYYERYRFRHVDSDAFKGIAEEVTGRDLDWFFGPWLHDADGVVDYALDDVTVRADGGGGWVTTFELERVGERRMPVPVRLRGGDAAADTVVDGMRLERTVSVRTTFRPEVVELDPDGTILDWNPLNDAWSSGLGDPAVALGWDDPTRPQPVFLGAVPVGLFPLAWVNDAGGWVAGVQVRSSLLGLSHKTLRLGLPAVPAGDRGEAGRGFDWGSLYVSTENPLLGDRPAFGLRARGFAGEGRATGRVDLARDLRELPRSEPMRAARVYLAGAWTYDEAYLVPGRWDPRRSLAGEAGAGLDAAVELLGMEWDLGLEGGVGFDTGAHRWVRGEVRASGVRDLDRGWRLRARLHAGGATGSDGAEGGGRWSGDRVPVERRFFLSTVDPWRSVGNPWIRSDGAALDEEGRLLGGGALAGFSPRLSFAWAATLAGELVAPAVTLGGDRGVELLPLAFTGLGTAARPGLPVTAGVSGDVDLRLEAGTLYWSAGMGLEMGRPGSPLRLRVEVPFAVSHPELAEDARDDEVGLRLQVAFGG